MALTVRASRGSVLSLSAVVVTMAAAARADDTPPEIHPSPFDRSHTVAVAEGGIIALPTAPISPSNRGGNTPLGPIGKGDATLQTGVHILYRIDRLWAVGAGAIFTPTPTSGPSPDVDDPQISRTHSRSYLFMGGEVRLFPLRSRWIEGWVGLTGGGIIVADRFSTNNAPNVPSLLGTNTVNVSTEGFAVGGQAGMDYLITSSLVVGLALRADWWLLPKEKVFSQESSCDPIGDCPTLPGSVVALELGVTVGYRIAL